MLSVKSNFTISERKPKTILHNKVISDHFEISNPFEFSIHL